MKKNLLQVLVVLALLLVGSMPAAAEVVDPQIIVRGGGITGTINVTSPNFVTTVIFDTDPRCHQFTGTLLGAPVPAMACPILNQTSSYIYSFTWIIVPAQLPLTFATQNVNGTFVLDQTQTILTFYFSTPLGPGDDVAVDFLNFAPGTPITFIAQTPEPGTMGLFLAGAGALVARFRRRKLAV